MIDLAQAEVGDYVHFVYPHGKTSNGRIKSVYDDQYAYVVFHCGGEWERFSAYTGELCRANRLHAGWPQRNST